MMHFLRVHLCLFILAIALVAQESRPTPPTVDAAAQAAVKETLSYLASDAMLGRDTPSPELETAAKYIAERFEKAGLSPAGTDGTWFHTYEKEVLVSDSTKLEVSVKVGETETKLVADTDVRIWRAPSAFECTDADAAHFAVGEALEKGLVGGRRMTMPLLLEVDAESPLWKRCAGRRAQLGGRPRSESTPPILLVRSGVLPAGECKATMKVAAPTNEQVTLKNVVGRWPGESLPDEHVLFSAHYDHIGVGLPVGGDAVNNGADDDATGTTAVIHLAEAFGRAGKKLPRSLLFVCFSGEEKGLLGSKAFVEAPPLPLENIVVDVNIELIGRPASDGRFSAWVTGREYSEFEDVCRPAFAAAGIETTAFQMEKQLFGASDNYSFAMKGIVAHTISAGFLHPDYHKPSDEVSKIDIEHMTAVIEGIRRVGEAFATTTKLPEYNDAGKKATAGRRR